MTKETYEIYPMADWTEEEFFSFSNIDDRLRDLGYVTASEPIVGMFAVWLSEITTAADMIANKAESLRRLHGYRGSSKALIAHLHRTTPEPAWSVEIDPAYRM